MEKHYQNHRSQLFTVRLWREQLGDGKSELRGKVQHVHSGEAYYFREWTALVSALLNILSRQEFEDNTSDESGKEYKKE